MTVHEQRMCEMQAEFFELSIDRFKCGSSLFISRFMNSELAKSLDFIDDPYNFVSPNNMITIMKMDFPSLKEEQGQKIPRKVMKWIGYIYRAWNVIKRKESSVIYKKMKASKMVALYESYHTFSPEYCIERLEEIIENDNPSLNDYEVFKQIYESN